MSKARTAVLYAPGINCHEETVAALELAGGVAEIVYPDARPNVLLASFAEQLRWGP